MHLTEAIETFLIVRQSEGLTANTLEWYRGTLIHFAGWLGPCRISEIKPVNVAGWLVSEHKRGLAPLTIEGNYRALLAFFNWCELSPDVGKPPSPMGHGRTKTIRRPKVDEPGMDYVTFDEYALVTNAIDLATWLDYRDWCLIGLMFWCGLRRGELLGMEVADLRLSKGEILIRQGKSRSQRPAYLLDDLAGGLRYYLQVRPLWSGPELWYAYNKARNAVAGPLSTTGLRLMLSRRCKRAGVRFLNPHLFRHGFAMNYLNNDAEMKAVSTLLGHSTMKTTERFYAKWLEGPLRAEHARVAGRIMSRE